jgi:hypothetical protein
MALAIPAGAVVDVQGAAVAGPVQVRLTGFVPGTAGFTAFPGNFQGLDAQGQEVELQTFGAFEATLQDDSGTPVFVAEGQTVTASVALPAGTSLQAGDEVPMWSMDLASGQWVQEPGVVATVVQSGSDLALVAALPHLSIWNFDLASFNRTCVRVTYPALEWKTGTFDVRVEALIGGQVVMTRQERIQGESVYVSRLSVDTSIHAQVLAGQRVIGEGTVLASPASSGCAELVLDLPGLRYTVGSGAHSIEHRLLAGTCPINASPVHVVLSTPGQAPVALDMNGHGVLQGLTAGTWTIDAYASAGDVGGPPLDHVVVQIPATVAECPEANRRTDHCVFYTSHTLPDSWAATPYGGCVIPPCRGEECQTCVDVTVTNAANEPLAGEFVSFYKPVEKAYASDDTGHVCLDISYGADAQLMIKTESYALPVSVVLPRDRSCSEGTCARRTLRAAESSSITCPAGHGLLVAKGLEYGMFDPGFLEEGQYPTTSAENPSNFTVQVTAGQLPLISTYINGYSYGFMQILQDLLGVERPGPFVIRNSTLDQQIGASLEFENFTRKVGWHTVTGSAQEGVLKVHLTIDSLDPQNLSRTRYRATGGQIYVYQQWPLVTIGELDLERIEGTGGDATASVWIYTQTPLFSQASTPLKVSNQKSHWLNGQTLRVFTEADYSAAAAGSLPVLTGGISYGPTGIAASDLFRPQGELEYCFPTTGWYMLVGEPSPGRLRPFTALQRFLPATGSTPNRLGLAGNDDPGAWLYATLDARWFDEQYVRAIYSRNGLPTASMFTTATILGAGRKVSGDYPVSALVSRATLTPGGGAGGAVLEAKIMNDDFVFQSGNGTLFVFVNVPTISTWYELVVYDEANQPIPGFQQRIMPVPGGIMVAVP